MLGSKELRRVSELSNTTPQPEAEISSPLHPVPVPAMASELDLSELAAMKPWLNNLEPLDDVAALALQVAMMTAEMGDMLARLDELERNRTCHPMTHPPL